MNEAERLENLEKRLTEITDSFIETFPEKRNMQLRGRRTNNIIHRVKDYLNDVKNKVIDGEITPSFEETLDKLENVIELTKSGSIKTRSGAPLYGKETVSLLNQIADDIKKEQKEVAKESKKKYRDKPTRYSTDFLSEVDEVLNRTEVKEEVQTANEIENVIGEDYDNREEGFNQNINQIEEEIDRIENEIYLISIDSSLNQEQKERRISQKKNRIRELMPDLQTFYVNQNIINSLNQIDKTKNRINEVGLEVEELEKDNSLSDKEKQEKIDLKNDEIYRLKNTLRRKREMLSTIKEYSDVLASMTYIQEAELIKNSKNNLQGVLDEIEALQKESEEIRNNLALLKDDSYVSDSIVYDMTMQEAIKEKEDRLKVIEEEIKSKRAYYQEQINIEGSKIYKRGRQKLDLLQQKIDTLDYDIVIPEELVSALATLNPGKRIGLGDYNTIAYDGDIKELTLPIGFYIDEDRITNKNTVFGDLYLNMGAKPLEKVLEENKGLKREIFFPPKPKNTEDKLVDAIKKGLEILANNITGEYSIEEINEFFENENKQAKEEVVEPEVEEQLEEPTAPIIAVSSIEQAKRFKAKVYTELQQIKSDITKNEQEYKRARKELKEKIASATDPEEKKKLKEELKTKKYNFNVRRNYLNAEKKSKPKELENYDKFIERYNSIKQIVIDLRHYVENLDGEIDYDYCLAQQQKILELRGEGSIYMPQNVLLEIAEELDCRTDPVDDEVIQEVEDIFAKHPPKPSNKAIAAILGTALLGGVATGVGVAVAKSFDNEAENTHLEQQEEETKKEEKQEENEKEEVAKPEETEVPTITEEEINEQPEEAKEENLTTQGNNDSEEQEPIKREEITDAGTKADPVHEESGFEPVVDTSQGVSDGGTNADPEVEGEDITDTSKYNGEVTDGDTTEDPMYSEDNEAIIEENTEEELPEDETIIEEEAPELEPAIEEETPEEEAPDLGPAIEEESPSEDEEVVNVEEVTPEESQEAESAVEEQPSEEETSEYTPLTQEQIDNFDEEDVIEAFVNKGTTKGGINLDNLSDYDKKALVDKSLGISAEKYDIPTGTPAPWDTDVLNVYYEDGLYNIDVKTK